MPRADANRRRCAIYTRKSSKTASSASRNNSPASSRRLFGSKHGLRPLDPQQRGVPSDSEQRAPGIGACLERAGSPLRPADGDRRDYRGPVETNALKISTQSAM